MSRATRFEVVKFDGSSNFGLWQIRFKDLLRVIGELDGHEGKEAREDGG